MGLPGGGEGLRALRRYDAMRCDTICDYVIMISHHDERYHEAMNDAMTTPSGSF
jgi:hypothetical protein